MYENAVCQIGNYMDRNYPEHVPIYNEAYFREQSYRRWALSELQQKIIEESFRIPSHITGRDLLTPSEITEKFINDLEYFLEIGEAPESRYVFTVAKETLEDYFMGINVDHGEELHDSKEDMVYEKVRFR